MKVFSCLQASGSETTTTSQQDELSAYMSSAGLNEADTKQLPNHPGIILDKTAVMADLLAD